MFIEWNNDKVNYKFPWRNVYVILRSNLPFDKTIFSFPACGECIGDSDSKISIQIGPDKMSIESSP